MAPGPRPRNNTRDDDEYTETQTCPKCGKECKRLSQHDHQTHSLTAIFDPRDGTEPREVTRQPDGNFKCPYCAHKLKTVVTLQSHYKHCPFIDLSSGPVPQIQAVVRSNGKPPTAVASPSKTSRSPTRFPGQPNIKRPAPSDADSQREAKRARKDSQTAIRGGHSQSLGRRERPPQSSSPYVRGSTIPTDRPLPSTAQPPRIAPPIRSSAPSPPLRPKEETEVCPTPTKEPRLPVANSGPGLTISPISPAKSAQVKVGKSSETLVVVPNLEPRHSPGRDPRRAKADRPIRALPTHPPSQRQATLANKPAPSPTLPQPTVPLPPRPNVAIRLPSPPDCAAASQSIASTAIVSQPLHPNPPSASPVQHISPAPRPTTTPPPLPPSQPNPSVPQLSSPLQTSLPAPRPVSTTPRPHFPIAQFHAHLREGQRTPQPMITDPQPMSPVSQPVSPVIRSIPTQPPSRSAVAEDDVLTPPPTPSISQRKLRIADSRPESAKPSVYAFLQQLERPLGAHIDIFDGLGIKSYGDLVGLRNMGDQWDRFHRKLEDLGLTFIDGLSFLNGLKSLKS